MRGSDIIIGNRRRSNRKILLVLAFRQFWHSKSKMRISSPYSPSILKINKVCYLQHVRERVRRDLYSKTNF